VAISRINVPNGKLSVVDLSVYTSLTCGMMKYVFLFFVLLAAHGCVAPSPDFDIELDAVTLPTRVGSLAPNLTVSNDGGVYVSWLDPVDDGGHALRYARYRPLTNDWTEPRTVASGDDWFVNWADVPSLAVGDDGVMVAQWPAYNGAGKYAYGIRLSRSTDGGLNWSSPVWLNEDASPVGHGFASLVSLDDGEQQAVWLDGRQYASGREAMMLMTRTIRNDGTLTEERVLDERTCDCCPTVATALPEGGILALYRNRTDDEIRDIYSVRFDNRSWTAPRPVHQDGWHIAGCPVNGPAVDVAGDHVAAAWFTAAGNTARVLAAFADDRGESFRDPVRVDLGRSAGRVDLVGLDDGRALVLWLEGASDERPAGLYVRKVDADGALSAPIRIMDTSTARSSGYPRFVRQGANLIFAWTETGDRPIVRTARAVLSR